MALPCPSNVSNIIGDTEENFNKHFWACVASASLHMPGNSFNGAYYM